jgi:nucleotidyltransferase substrate binding protein (TIGR01987 family)
MNKEDIRWKQRFDNFIKAYKELEEVERLVKQRPLTKLEKQGLIQCFEYNHELAWNVLKDYLEEQGFINIIGSKNATREAFKQNLINDGEVWMNMIKDRNLTSHAYDKKLADEIIDKILNKFYPELKIFAVDFTKKCDTE